MAPLDLVKLHRPLYSPSARHPAIVEVPELAFLMVDGRGDPNTSEAYQDALQALYSVAYTLKFTLKKADPERDFKVAPLEGLWWADEADAHHGRAAARPRRLELDDADRRARRGHGRRGRAPPPRRRRGGASCPPRRSSAWSASTRASRRRSCTSAPTRTRPRPSRACTRGSPRRATSCAAATTRSTWATPAAPRPNGSRPCSGTRCANADRRSSRPNSASVPRTGAATVS